MNTKPTRKNRITHEIEAHIAYLNGVEQRINDSFDDLEAYIAQLQGKPCWRIEEAMNGRR